MATDAEKKVVAAMLRGRTEYLSDAQVAVYRAVADELDPPAPRTVTVQGCKFGYEDGVWMRFVDSASPWWRYASDVGSLLDGLTPTLAEYEALLKLASDD